MRNSSQTGENEDMKIAVIGASGKLGRALVAEALRRGCQVAAICRESSVVKLEAFHGEEGFTLFTAALVSEVQMLERALAGCDAVITVSISVRDTKMTQVVNALARAASVNGITRTLFSAGEVTVRKNPEEAFTLRQRLMMALVPAVIRLTPYSVSDMLRASDMVKAQAGWNWTIIRAPTLVDARIGDPGEEYRLGRIDEVTARHKLSRQAYANSLLDSVANADHYKRMLAVLPA
jgi:putative NADH-flavin reductase